jgi:hypothetical protein
METGAGAGKRLRERPTRGSDDHSLKHGSKGLYICRAVGEARVCFKKVGNGKEPYDLMMVWAKGGRLKCISLGACGQGV